MKAQFVRGLEPKKSMKIGLSDEKTKKRELANICQEMMEELSLIIKKENIHARLTPAFSFDGPIEEWGTEVDIRFPKTSNYFWIRWENGIYTIGEFSRTDSIIFSDIKFDKLEDAVNKIKRWLK